MINETITVPEEAKEKRIDLFLASYFVDKFSRSKIKEFIVAGKVRVDEKAVKPNFSLFPGQIVHVEFEETAQQKARAENIPLEIVFEDNDILVVNKPAGMVVHPAHGNTSGTLVNALLHHTQSLSKMGGDIRAGIIHRLDKDTSGLLLVAKNDTAHEFLSHQFKHHKIEKVYWVVVKGRVHHDEMRSEKPLGRSPHDRRKMIVQLKEDGGKESKTDFKVLERFKTATLLEARPKTGRTHQIRVHLKHLGYPVLGDRNYGIPSLYINRQALHAKFISFIHPTTTKKIAFDSDLPQDMKELIKSLQ